MTDHDLPSLPKSVLEYGLVGRYVDLMTPLYEGPPEFHFGAAMAIISAALPNVTLEWGESGMHLNLYVILVGRTRTSKSEIRRNAAKLLVDRKLERSVDAGSGDDEDDWKLIAACEHIHQIRAIGSAEGIEDDLVEVAFRNPAELFGEIVPALLNLDEFTAYLKKAASTGTSNFSEFMIWAYDGMADFRRPLSKKPGRDNSRKLPLLLMSLSSDTTPLAFTETFKSSHSRGGFFNRLDLYTGKRGPAVPRVRPVDRQRMEKEVLEPLSIAIDDADRKSGGIVLTLSEEAGVFYDKRYVEYVYPLMEEEGSELFKRYSTKALKYAGLFCVLDGSAEITVEHIKLGLAVADYLKETAVLFGGTIGDSDRSEALDKIVEVTEKHGPFRLLSDCQPRITERIRKYINSQPRQLSGFVDDLIANDRLVEWEERGFAHPDAAERSDDG